MEEIRLPKCLTESEAKIVKEYNEYIFGKIAESESGPLLLSGPDVFIHTKAFKIPLKEYENDNSAINAIKGGSFGSDIFTEREYQPFKDVAYIDLTASSLNQSLYNSFRRVMIQKFGNNNIFDTIKFFNRSYAFAIFSLNNIYPELHYEFWSNLWDEIYSEKDPYACELICCCMIYRILEYENEPRLNNLLEEIRWRLEASQCGINLETLEQFKITIPQTAPAEPVKHSASKKPKEGRAKDYLFKKNQTEALAKEFLLELRNKGFEDFNGRKSPAPKKRCEIYRALMKFIRNHNGSVEVKSGASICRFLTASCGILLPKEGNNNSNYETEIRKILNE